MALSNKQLFVGALIAGAIGAIGVNVLMYDGANAATKDVRFDSDSARGLTATIDKMPDGGCRVNGCMTIGTGEFTHQSCVPWGEMKSKRMQSACNAMLDNVSRRVQAKLEFPKVDAGE